MAHVQVELADLARAVIGRLLKARGLDDVAKAVMAPAIYTYRTIEGPFLYAVDDFERHYAEGIEFMFDRLHLTAAVFKQADDIAEVMRDVVQDDTARPLTLGVLLACISYLMHICMRLIKADGKVEAAYVEQMISTLVVPSAADWAKICGDMLELEAAAHPHYVHSGSYM